MFFKKDPKKNKKKKSSKLSSILNLFRCGWDIATTYMKIRELVFPTTGMPELQCYLGNPQRSESKNPPGPGGLRFKAYKPHAVGCPTQKFRIVGELQSMKIQYLASLLTHVEL
jgi:hypothetical protein